MRTFLSVVLALATVALIVLAVTNPQLHDFEVFVEEQPEPLVQKKPGTSAVSKALAGDEGSLLATYTEQFAQREDYILFSVYVLDAGAASAKDQQRRFLGIAGRFIPLDEPKEKARARR